MTVRYNTAQYETESPLYSISTIAYERFDDGYLLLLEWSWKNVILKLSHPLVGILEPVILAQVHQNRYTNTSTPAQVHQYRYTSLSTQKPEQVHQHKYINTGTPELVHH